MFQARFDGVCVADCGSRIHPGDLVEYDDNHQLRHIGCRPIIRPPKLVCGTCWLEKPCACDAD